MYPNKEEDIPEITLDTKNIEPKHSVEYIPDLCTSERNHIKILMKLNQEYPQAKVLKLNEPTKQPLHLNKLLLD